MHNMVLHEHILAYLCVGSLAEPRGVWG